MCARGRPPPAWLGERCRRCAAAAAAIMLLWRLNWPLSSRTHIVCADYYTTACWASPAERARLCLPSHPRRRPPAGTVRDQGVSQSEQQQQRAKHRPQGSMEPSAFAVAAPGDSKPPLNGNGAQWEGKGAAPAPQPKGRVRAWASQASQTGRRLWRGQGGASSQGSG